MKKNGLDELKMMDEYNLSRLLNYLEDRLTHEKRRGYKRDSLEIELCYVQREMEVRKHRKIAHLNYLSSKNNQMSSV
jgi:hypothetical protein